MTKAYVITIMDNDKSVEVAKRCVGSAQLRGTEVEMFPAITPKDDPVKLLKEKGIDPKAFDEVYSRNLNCIAAFLSHHSLWEKCAKGNENFVIFEHDAFVHSPIPVNAKFSYVMNIGQPSYGSYNTPSVLGVNPLTTKRYFGGAHAYMITPAGAELLVQNAPLHARPTDIYMNLATFPWLQEYYPFVADARDSFTTIQVERGCIAKHNFRDEYEIIDA